MKKVSCAVYISTSTTGRRLAMSGQTAVTVFDVSPPGSKLCDDSSTEGWEGLRKLYFLRR